jgi:hypothetical protein
LWRICKWSTQNQHSQRSAWQVYLPLLKLKIVVCFVNLLRHLWNFKHQFMLVVFILRGQLTDSSLWFSFCAVSWQIQVDLASSALYTFLNTTAGTEKLSSTLTETDNYKKSRL